MQLNDLQNKHKDEIIFIIGAGPSINDINIDLLKDHTVMAVNSGILAAPFAKYFVSDDVGVINWSYFNDIKKSDCICLFYKNKWEHITGYLPKERVSFYRHKSWFSPPSTYNSPDGLILTKDINKPIIGSRISTGSCVHLAYCLGAKIIVLLGNDCQLSKDKYNYRYFWQYWPKDKQPYRIKGNKFNTRTQNVGFDQKSLIEYWDKFSEYNKQYGILGKEVEIIDCSNSSLNCFPKMFIQEILNKYGDKNEI